jgi:sugar O-acyltransferase (sialic acid O-acetyltransferase NeuD family)
MRAMTREALRDRMTAGVLVFGAGGHGRVIADALVAAGEPILGFLDEEKAPGTVIAGLPVLGAASSQDLVGARVALGIGDNAARARIAADLEEKGASLLTVVHPRAVVARSALLGDGTVVMALAVINADARIGRGAIINTGAVVEHDCDVGNFAHISPNATLGGGVSVGEITHIGIGATVLPKRRIGARSVMGAGAVVVHDLPDDVVAVGVPARIRR